ncbi:transcription antitermination factor NusB [Candidatus Woesebacteria bacterium]|nr:transcription antitermination factor NusB [Candidatus Woesebacteria bacterium]
MNDPRHERRVKIVQNIYAHLFYTSDQKVIPPYKEVQDISQQILDQTPNIDAYIATHAPKYPVDKISKIDLSILRLAIFEILIEKKEPEKVIINEAVELAKELGNDRSYAFINAVLGAILQAVTNEEPTPNE